MRPLAGVLCAGEGTFVLDGTPRMRERPINELVDGLLQVSVIVIVSVSVSVSEILYVRAVHFVM